MPQDSRGWNNLVKSGHAYGMYVFVSLDCLIVGETLRIY